MNRPLLLVPVALLLMGCPLQVPVTIDNGSAVVPAWLPGNWRELTENPNADRYMLEAVPDSMGIVYAHPMDSVGDIAEFVYHSIVLSAVGDKVFAFVESDGLADEEGYMVYRLDIESETLVTLSGVMDAGQPRTPDALRTWLLENKDSEDLIDPTELMRFVKE